MEKKKKAKKEICRIIDQNSKEIISTGEKLFTMPEKSFQEFETSRFVGEIFKKGAIPFESGLAITGIRADLRGGKKGPVLALLGELDALAVPSHPFADKHTGAAHACGHHAQLSGLLGAALALKKSGIMESLSGGIAFMAVPAEEINDINYRLSLKKAGRITFLSGKQEFIRIGCFDDVDMAVMIHTGSGGGAGLAESYNGFVVKLSRFTGRASHSAAAPELGINALQAANLALTALNAQCETYMDQDRVRVHSVIDIPSAAVNVITAEAVVETQVRAASIEAILGTAKKADRALRSGAMALGAKVAIETLPGYMPALQNKALTDIYKKNATSFIPEKDFFFHPPRSSSTDMGDVSQVVPSIHPYLGGAQGKAHSSDYEIKDKYMAYVLPAKVLAMCAIDLLWDDASAAKRIIKESKTPFTIKGYIELQKKNFHKAVYNYTGK